MAKMNYSLGEAFASGLLKVKGPGPLAEVDELLQCTLSVDRESVPEHWGVQGIAQYSRFLEVSAVVAQHAYQVLWNPITPVVAGSPSVPTLSNDRLTIALRVECSAAAILSVGQFYAAWWLVWGGLAGNIPGHPHDLRRPQPSTTQLYYGSDAAASLAAFASPNYIGYAWDNVVQQTRKLDIMLPPGWGVYVRGFNLNTGLICSWSWVERSMFP